MHLTAWHVVACAVILGPFVLSPWWVFRSRPVAGQFADWEGPRREHEWQDHVGMLVTVYSCTRCRMFSGSHAISLVSRVPDRVVPRDTNACVTRYDRAAWRLGAPVRALRRGTAH